MPAIHIPEDVFYEYVSAYDSLDEAKQAIKRTVREGSPDE